MDWPFWRGPEMNGVSREKGIVSTWKQSGGEGSNLLWANKELKGKSTPIVMKGKLYMLARDQPETKKEGEKYIHAGARYPGRAKALALAVCCRRTRWISGTSELLSRSGNPRG